MINKNYIYIIAFVCFLSGSLLYGSQRFFIVDKVTREKYLCVKHSLTSFSPTSLQEGGQVGVAFYDASGSKFLLSRLTDPRFTFEIENGEVYECFDERPEGERSSD